MIIYIAGPMSGHPQNNYPAFWLAANKFRAHGFTVLNPAELPILPDWQAYMRASLAIVAKATHIHFLPCDDTSRGAQTESFIAKELGPLFYNAGIEEAIRTHQAWSERIQEEMDLKKVY